MRQELPARSLEAVFCPARYRAFVGLTAPGRLEEAWRDGRWRPWVLANLAHAAYHDGGRVRGWLGASDVELRSYEARGAHALLALWPERAVLTFRGSEVWQRPGAGPFANDLLANLHVTLAAWGGALVHRGFLGELDKVWGAGIEADLARARDLPLWITGHSLGGAMATLAALRVLCEAVVTFGEPRVGRQLDRALPPGRHTRYVNGNDPVPAVPPGWWPFRYETHGAVVRLRDPRGPSATYDHGIPYYAQLLAPAEAGRVVQRLGRGHEPGPEP